VKRFCSILFAIGFVLTTSATAMPAEDQQVDAQAQQLLQKHRDYVGWQFGDGTFRTMRITGTVTNKKGEKLRDVTSSYAGLAFQQTRMLLKQGGITWHEGFTGTVFWQSYENGFTMPLYGASAQAIAAYNMLMEEGTTGLPGTFRGNKTVDGKQVSVVRVTMMYSKPIDLYIDPATGAYVKAVVDPDGPFESTYHILSYADVLPGKKMVASYRVDDDGDVHTNVKWEPNADVTSEELHPPKPSASWTFSSDQPVPIHLTHDRILVDATVNGVKGTFILDTGSDAIRLDDQFADRAKVQVSQGNSEAESLYGSVKERIRKVNTFDFGNATLQNVTVYSENFEKNDYEGLDAKGYAGLIGSDFFAGAIVKLNVYDSTMSILDPNTDLSAIKGLPVFVDLSDGELTVPMTLDNSLTVNAMLDTGNPGAVLFSYDLTKKHYSFNPQMLTLGPIHYTIGGWDQCCMGGNYALLGFDFLKHFDYVFDYPHGRMFMTLNKN
jgi:hypothetical protein